MTHLFSTYLPLSRIFLGCVICASAAGCGASDPAQATAGGGTSAGGVPAHSGAAGATIGAGGRQTASSAGAGGAGAVANNGGNGGAHTDAGAGASGLNANGGSAGGAATSSGGAANGGAATSSGGVANGGAATSGGAANGGGSTNGGGNNGGSAGAGKAGAGSSGAPGSGGSTSTPPHTGVWRITPLGDSITGTTCGPQLLSKELKDKGHTNFLFAGSNLNNQNCNGAAVVQTEGHGGYLVTDLVGNGQHAAELPQWTSSDKADIVLMHFGTNDVWNNIAPATILSAYSTVLADLRTANSRVIVFVAQIIPMNPAGCAQCETRVEALNAQIPSWASSKSTTDSPIYVVDQHSVFTPATYTPASTYTADGVHPNVAGGQLMADKWYGALTAHGIP
jgi:lysophospholipase L1-like esterase